MLERSPKHEVQGASTSSTTRRISTATPGIFQRPFAPMQPQPHSTQPNLGMSLDNDKVIQLLTSLT